MWVDGFIAVPWPVFLLIYFYFQVQAVIRHGARAPYAKPQCWAGYDYTWDCNVTEVSQASITHALYWVAYRVRYSN